MPGVRSLSAAAAAAILLFWFQSVAVLHARPLADENYNIGISQARFPVTPTGKVAALRKNPPTFDGKVDIFLDLACPDSAAAWTTIRQIVWDYGFRTEIVFHVLPTPRNQMAFDTAKAVQAVQLFSTDNDEVVHFIDAMFDYHPLILDGAGDGVARLGFRGILTKWAIASANITDDQFESMMEASEVDHMVRYETGAAARLGIYTTPTALLNGSFMMRLIGAKQLNDFRLMFVASAGSLTPDGSDGGSISEPVEGRSILDGDDDIYLKYYGIGDSNHPEGAGEEVLENAKAVIT